MKTFNLHLLTPINRSIKWDSHNYRESIFGGMFNIYKKKVGSYEERIIDTQLCDHCYIQAKTMKSEYVRSLNLPNQKIYVNFYQEFENGKNQFEIGEHMSNSYFLNTKQLDCQNNQNGQKKSYSAKDNKQTPETQDGDNSEQYQEILPYTNSCIKDSKYKKIWKQINLQQFRYFILNDTADQIQTEFSQDKYQLSYIVQYTLRKQSYFILREIYIQLNSNENSWQETNKNEWGDFQKECKYEQLKFTIQEEKKKQIEHMKKISLELEKVKNEDLFLTYLCGHEDLKVMVDSILLEIQILIKFNKDQGQGQGQKDQDQGQGQFNLFLKYDQQQCYQGNIQLQMGNQKNLKILSTEFENQLEHWQKGYKLILNDQYQFLKQFQKDPDYKKKYSRIILQVLFCRLVKLIFSYEQINSQFKHIQKKVDEEKVDEDDIYRFLQSKDNYELKYQEVEHLLNKYFKQKKQL